MLLLHRQRSASSVACAGLQSRELHADAGSAGGGQAGSLTSLREKLVKIGANVVRKGRYVIFQMAEVGVPKELFQEILRLINGLRPRLAPV